MAYQRASEQNARWWGFVRATERRLGWSARIAKQPFKFNRKLNKQEFKNETPIISSRSCRLDRVSSVNVVGCSDSGARQETKHRLYHGGRRRLVSDRRLPSRYHVWQDTEP